MAFKKGQIVAIVSKNGYYSKGVDSSIFPESLPALFLIQDIDREDGTAWGSVLSSNDYVISDHRAVQDGHRCWINLEDLKELN